MKLVTNKFKSGGLHEKHVVATWKPSQHLLLGIGKPRKTCVEMAGRRTLLLLLLLLLLTAIGLSPCGSGYFTCIQNMKLVTNKFKWEGYIRSM